MSATLFENARLTKPYDQEASNTPDHVAVLVEAVHPYSRAQRKHQKIRTILVNSRFDFAHEMNVRIAP